MQLLALMMIPVAILLVVAVIFLWRRARRSEEAAQSIQERFKDVLDVSDEVATKQAELEKLTTAIESTRTDYKQKRQVYDALSKEVQRLEEDLEIADFGLYKPHFDFDTSEKYKDAITSLRDKQKALIRSGDAVETEKDWIVEGSERKGARLAKQYSKVMLRAFNGECDAAVLKVRWNNATRMEERLERAYSAINKLGTAVYISITREYCDLKLKELQLTHEYKVKKQEEKEEQRRIRQEMREEERAQRELEQAQKEAEAEERRYERALEKARKEAAAAQGVELDALNQQLASLEQQLQEAQSKRERAISRAQQTKSGHVYIISNIGSFGDGVVKIGMTRRLEPLDRIKELGDASVPFGFDVHAMAYSEDAPQLESALHNELDEKRVNLVNRRKEFFEVTLREVEEIVRKHSGEIEFTKLAEAQEYRETLQLRKESSARTDMAETSAKQSKTVGAEFPDSL